MNWASFDTGADLDFQTDDADGDLPEGVPEEERKEKGTADSVKEKIVYVDTRTKVPRGFYITRADVEKYGRTRGCGGCTSWERWLGSQVHSEKCRERFRELLKDAAKMKNFEKRREARPEI